MWRDTDRFENWFVTSLQTSVNDTTDTFRINKAPNVQQGRIIIDPFNDEEREIVYFGGRDGNLLTDLVRGDDHTDPHYHLEGTLVVMNVVGADLNDLYADWATTQADLDDWLVGAQTTLDDAVQAAEDEIDAITADVQGYAEAVVDEHIESYILDEDDMASDSDTKAPSQQSVKAYLEEQLPVIAFWVTKTNTQNFTNAFTPVVWNSEVYDIGNCFNTSTGEFTAPYDGIYHFDASIRMNGSGERKIMSFYKDAEQIARVSDEVQSYSAQQHSGSMDIYLEAGEKVYVQFWSASVQSNNTANGLSFFSGHLVRRITLP